MIFHTFFANPSKQTILAATKYNRTVLKITLI